MQDGKGGRVHREWVSQETLQVFALRERPLQQVQTSLGRIICLPGSSFLSSYRISGVSRKAGLQVVRHDFLLTRSPALSGQWTLLLSASDGFFNH